MNGQKQREALSAAERSLTLLEKDRFDDAVAAAGHAAELDQIGAYVTLPDAVGAAAGHLREGRPVPPEVWDRVAGAVGAGPLAAIVDRLRA
ncbi:MAG: hypothetical protein HKN74_03560 [Acidimicrobiia bacterium]|nr:hypothetical protein [Acidimicrobiia bacterium]MBT8215408.1 hypothetical protein [Acidimicrobiia bacterium]NNF09341.1 hypothetical protein [Acidimicrobiia bacterium]NNL71301.1 hypothetical protein [Acidimicrobiia bacterium]